MRWRVLAALVVVGVTGWWLSDFRLQTFHAAGAHTYPFDFQGARWIEAADPAPRAYFRYDFSLLRAPDRATLWVDANQSFTAYANTYTVGTDTRDVTAGRVPQVVPIDVTHRLVSGQNAIAFQVTNGDGGVAAMRARLTVVSGGKLAEYTTSASQWRATANVSQVKPRLSVHAHRFSDVAFDDGAWPVARSAPSIRDRIESAVPPQVVERPLDAVVIGPPQVGGDMVATTILDLPGDPSDGWLRVSASGPYAIFADGTLLTSRTQPLRPVVSPQTPPAQLLSMYNLGPYLHSGRNVVAVHVTADPLAALYLDGTVQTSKGDVVVSTSSDWRASGPPFLDAIRRPPALKASFLGSTDVVWPQGLTTRVAGVSKVNVPAGINYSDRAVTVGGIVLLWILLGGAVALASGIPMSRALVADAGGHLPGAVALAALAQLARLVSIVPPFPHVPAVLLGVILTIFAGKVVAALAVTGVLERVASRLRAVVGAVRVRLGAMPRSTAPGAAMLRRRWDVGGRLLRHWHVAGVAGVAAGAGGLMAYRLDYEPLWQDELASLVAAQGMRTHLIPRLPSGFLYWKGELYSGVIAAVGAVTHDDIISLRFLSVLWYAASILAFGLLLVPLVLPRRRVAAVALTTLFATAPPELAWARDVRMYQMAQFFAIVFIVLFIRALRSQKTSAIAASAVVLVLMYLSHEETFIFLPVVPIVFLAVMRLRWIRDWRWWVFGGGALAIIAGQFLLTVVTHPPYFGYDHSNKPYIQWDPHNFWFYITKVYFPAGSRGAALTIVSTLAVIAGVVGAVRRSWNRVYLSACLWVPVIALSTVFSPKIARYVFVTFPVLFALAGAGALDVAGGVRRLLTSRESGPRERTAVRMLATAMMVPGFFWIALSTTNGLRDYGLAVARLTGSSVSHRHTDYDVVGRYVRKHMLPGDLLISLAPPNLIAYYAGRPPDMNIATGRDKFLYLMERNSQAVDTAYGSPAILTSTDLLHVLGAHRRIWVVTDQGPYLRSVNPDIEQTVLANFDVVSEGATAAAYFRSD